MNSRKSYIEKLVEQGEHQTQDFKFEVSDSKKIARTLSAFSNTDGGRLLIGVKDNGALAGIRSEEEFHMLQAAAQMYCKPEVPLEFKEWNIGGKQILEVTIHKTENDLVTAPDKNGVFKVFVRLADQNILANGIFIQAWNQRKEARPVKISYTDIEKEFLSHIEKMQAISWSQLKKHLKLSPKKLNQLVLDFLLLEVIDLDISEKGYFYKLNNKQIDQYEATK